MSDIEKFVDEDEKAADIKIFAEMTDKGAKEILAALPYSILTSLDADCIAAVHRIYKMGEDRDKLRGILKRFSRETPKNMAVWAAAADMEGLGYTENEITGFLAGKPIAGGKKPLTEAGVRAHLKERRKAAENPESLPPRSEWKKGGWKRDFLPKK